MVNVSVIISLVIQAVVSVGVPVGFLIYFYRKYRISMKPVLIGLLVFIVFSQILEKILHVYILQINPETSEWLKNPFLYAVYGGLAAGIFEEVGRFIGFRYLLKNYREWKDGMAYGIGHGGIEAFLIGGFGAVQMIMYAFMINSGGFDSIIHTAGSAAPTLQALKDQLVHMPAYMVLLGSLERLTAFALQLGLSVLVLYVVCSKRIILLPVAILVHGAIDFVAGLYQSLHLSIFWVEGLFLVVGILSIIFVVKSKGLFSGVESR